MGDDRSVSIIVYIQLNAFDPKIKVFQIAINFAVTSQLISRKIGIMRAVAIVVTQGQILIKYPNRSCRIVVLIQDVQWEIVKTDHLFGCLSNFIYKLRWFMLLLSQKGQKWWSRHGWFQIFIKIMEFDTGIFLKNSFELIATAGNFVVCVDLLMCEKGI